MATPDSDSSVADTLAATIARPSLDADAGADKPPSRATGATVRATVLPRVVAAGGEPQPREVVRYEQLKTLGVGGVGEVTLARDNDIHRTVAVKRLRPDVLSSSGVLRFAEEIRTVGQLEHPNIVPIHDVGVDDTGNYYFVMKYVDGETLESVIRKLAAGDAEYHAKYTFDFRVRVFLGIANAIHYAHARGIIHRDIKPANVMVGPFGEVMMMDWGLARPIREPEAKPDAAALALALAPTGDPDKPAAPEPSVTRERLFRTQHGTLIGTPAYMSPEQALGRNDEIDERSDIYALCAVFFELLTLRHYLDEKKTIGEMLLGVISDPSNNAAHLDNPHQPRVPPELAWFVDKGLAKKPSDRYASMDEMVGRLNRVVDGDFDIRCYATMMKRGGSGFMHFIDAHPRKALATLVTTATAVIVGLGALVSLLVGR